MALSDEDIRVIIDVELGEDGISQLLTMVGAESSGDSVQDLKIMAGAMGVEAEDLLYALFVNDPIFNDDTWTDLTTGDGST
jgi:hypothetical protein